MKVNIIYPIIAILLIIFIMKNCEQEPKVVTKTKVEYVKVTDTFTKTIINEVPKTVYVEKIKDSIVYVDKPSNTSIKANQYTTKLESNNAIANLKITTTGELLDVAGAIEYTRPITNIETIKKVPQSGLFLYAETSINPIFERAALGLDYQIKNTALIGTSIDYSNLTKSVNFNVKVGFVCFKTL